MNAPNDQVYRKYQGLVFQSRYRITDNWTVNGQDTVQLQNYGNYEGEGSNTPGSTSAIGNYPEAFDAARTLPVRRPSELRAQPAAAVEHLQLDDGLDAAPSRSRACLRVESGLAYSLAAKNVPLTSTQTGILTAAGYPDQPGPADAVLHRCARGSELLRLWRVRHVDQLRHTRCSAP